MKSQPNNSNEYLSIFKRRLKKLENRYRYEVVTTDTIKKLENMAKNAFYQSFPPDIKDIFRPVITFNADTLKFSIDIQRKKKN